MFLVRESLQGDLDQILQIAEHLDSYNLPFDRQAIKEVLAASEAAFACAVPPAERSFTFVVENSKTGEIVGTSMIHAQHGTHSAPHVYLDVLQDEHYSESLQRYMVHQALLIGYNYNGPSEIGGLILLPEYRRHAESLGKLVSYARFLFIAMNRAVFRGEVLSELLPRLEEDGTSRLWKHYGKRFTGLTYREADRLSKDNKEFIRTLFPQGLVYSCLFPQEVQDEIGEVGPQTKGVEKMLNAIGFKYANQIDPFDGGPHFIASTDQISLVANAQAHVDWTETKETGDDRWLVAASLGQKRFRCAWSDVPPGPAAEVMVSAEAAEKLNLETGHEFWRVKP